MFWNTTGQKKKKKMWTTKALKENKTQFTICKAALRMQYMKKIIPMSTGAQAGTLLI